MNFAGGNRLHDFKVVLSNYDWSSYPGFLSPQDYETCFYHKGTPASGALVTVDCSHLQVPKARYVYIVKEDEDTYALSLCEVQVFEECK